MAEEYALPGDNAIRSGSRTHTIAVAALLAALLAASAWITIPIGAVPVTLQVFVVLLAGLVLSPGSAAAAVGVYLLLGTAGVPVFSGGTGGFGVLLGPTGGYLVGFFFAAPLISVVRS
ncbi:MAG: biotin transporter BioY, partial [Coriobacteriia bacterium]|nr:biotin transporter BioY [Coriobacteriia bacterium]